MRSLAILLGLIGCTLQTAPSRADLFGSDEPLALRLQADWQAISRQTGKDPEELPAVLTLDGREFTVKVRARGQSRRTKYCRFPPLLLNLPRKQMTGTIFEGQNKLKLATHCGRLGSNRQRFSDGVHAERAVYEALQLLTPNSFRTRQVVLTYVSPSGEEHSHPAFFIEHKRELATRLNGTVLETYRVAPSRLDVEQAALASLFAYFAGNVDYSLWAARGSDECCHNVLPLQVGESVLPIPYDFDSTGFVDPPYAEVPDNVPIRDLKQRRYRGYCRHNAGLAPAVQRFLVVRSEMQALATTAEHMSATRRRQAERYIERFYAVLDDDARFQREIIRRCR